MKEASWHYNAWGKFLKPPEFLGFPSVNRSSQGLLCQTHLVIKSPILWPPDAKSRLTGKDPDAGKDWEQEEKQVTEVEMAGWHHWLNGHELEPTWGDGGG